MDADLIIALTGLATGAFGVFTYYSTKKKAQTDIVKEYLTAMRDPDFIAARRYVYQQHAAGGSFAVGNVQAATVINFYHTWGALARQGYLPMWVFKQRLSGPGAMRLYEILEDLINGMREKHDDETYANGYVWLYHELGKIYAKPDGANLNRA